ncbi:MAG: sulfite exporter TauE/SafE family protein [Pannonibacter sp.]
MTAVLAVLFFLTAALYAAVGFGGGSTYNALLVLQGTDYRILPLIALTCNVLVVAGGVIRFWQTKQLAVQRLAPFLITSIPFAWLGGRLPIPETAFVALLGGALLVSGLHLAFSKSGETGAPVHARSAPAFVNLMTGAGIGLVSGLVGVGGGIFLAPVLYFQGWGTPRQIAAASSLFILVNSLSGLLGQAMKLQEAQLVQLAEPYWPLLPSVIIGGQIGSWLASQRLHPELVKRLTAVLILYVAGRLLYRFARTILPLP